MEFSRLVLAFLALAPLFQLADALPASVRGSEILVHGQPLFLKGINWNPVPAGRSQTNGGVDFRGYVEADSVLMAAAGINAIRTYQAITDPEVLDILWSRGIHVLNTVYMSGNADVASVVKPVMAVKDHPAILMWCVGNEWNYNMLYSGMMFADALARVHQVASEIKRIDQSHPVATVYGMMPAPYQIAALDRVIDVWGLTAYTGISFGKGPDNLFNLWTSRTKKPMFVAEFGADAYNALTRSVDEEAQARATTALAKEVTANSVQQGGGCIGGFIFELADEWWKDGKSSPFTHDAGGVAPGGGPYPDHVFNEEYWGIVRNDGTLREAYKAYAAVPMPVGTQHSRASEASVVGQLARSIEPVGYRLRACGASPQCRGLLGNCCPTKEGILMGCCSPAARAAAQAHPQEPTWQPQETTEPPVITVAPPTTAGPSPTHALATTLPWSTSAQSTAPLSPTITLLPTTTETEMTMPPTTTTLPPGTTHRHDDMVDIVNIQVTDNHEFIATLAIGSPPQTLRCLLDSGSADIWIPAQRCSSCGSQRSFDHTMSATFRQDSREAPWPQAVQIPYGEGMISGLSVRESVGLGAVHMRNQSLILAVDAFLPAHPSWDGICGLGWRQLARVHRPWYGHLQEEGRRALMALVPLPSPGEASLVVGTVPQAAIKEGSLVWVAVDPFQPGSASSGAHHSFWVVQGGLAVRKPKPVPVRFLVDTGTSQALLSPPKHYGSLVHSLIPKSVFYQSCSFQPEAGNLVVCDCSVTEDSQLPELRIYLGGRSFSLTAAQLFVRRGDVCHLQVRPNGNKPSLSEDQLGGVGGLIGGLLDSILKTNADSSTPPQTVTGGSMIPSGSHPFLGARQMQAVPGDVFPWGVEVAPAEDPMDDIWVLGGAFLANFVTAFDFDEARMGFAELATARIDLMVKSSLPDSAQISHEFSFSQRSHWQRLALLGPLALVIGGIVSVGMRFGRGRWCFSSSENYVNVPGDPEAGIMPHE